MLAPELIDSYEMDGFENRPLNNTEIQTYLTQHGISFKVQNNEVLTWEFGGTHGQIINCTGWYLFDLLSFLNY